MIEKNILLLLMLLPLLFSCGGGSSNSGAETAAQENTTETTTDAQATTSNKIIVIGDSISTGYSITSPWPNLLRSRVSYDIINNSSNGQQTAWGLGQISSLISQHNPSKVLILLGTNNAIRGSVSGAISDLQSMVNIARRNNVTAIVATLPPITRSGFSSENSRAKEISNGIRRLSGATIVNVRSAMGNGSGLLADGIHPNAEGQRIIANEFAGRIN